MYKRLDFAALSAWLVASLFMAGSALVWFGQDFRGYYAAGRVLLSGGNPYDYHALAPVLYEVTGQVGNNPYYYAPWFAWLIIPFTGLPFDLARGLWMFINVALWVTSLWQLSQLLQWPPLGWRRWSLFLLSTLVFAWITWRYEQTGILLLALFVGALIALKHKHGILAGVSLALLLIKPNVTLIPVLAITGWLIRRRDWTPVLTMALLTLGMLMAAFVTTPNLLAPILEPNFGQGLYNVLDGPEQIVGTRINTTLYDWLVLFQVTPQVASSISALVFLIGIITLAIISWRSHSLMTVAVTALVVDLAITPYALQYDYPPLTLVLFWSLSIGRFARHRWTAIFGALITCFILSIPFWERPISDGYWIVIGLIALALLNWYTTESSRVPSALL